jgi:hypothetical protein
LHGFPIVERSIDREKVSNLAVLAVARALARRPRRAGPPAFSARTSVSGASYDPGGVGHAAAELLLNIIGRDTNSVGRKYKSKWIGQLPTKIVITSNEVPNLRDASGVLPTRRMRAAIEAMPHEHPRLGAVAVGSMNGEDFASLLERAIQRSGKVIDVTPNKQIES